MNKNLLLPGGRLNCSLSTYILLKRMCIFLRSYTLIGIALFIVSACATPGAGPGAGPEAGKAYKDVPNVIDPNAKYLFYMHGIAIEQGGPRAKAYDYSGILKELANRGFVVIREKRSQVRPDMYAQKVAGQVSKLLAGGVPAKNITVAGHSKGGLITMLVMSFLADPDIAYVNFAGCGLPGGEFERGYLQFTRNRASMARGQMLSAYDRSDKICGSCKLAMDKMTNAVVTERVLDIGGGHELFYQPKAKWLDILQAWAERR